MLKQPFVVLDLETTGVYANADEILEVACIRYQGGKEVARFASLVKPDKAIPPLISVITGITAADVTSAPAWELVKPDVQKIVDGAMIVAHNTAFDTGFLKVGGIRLEGPFLDTVPLAQIAFPDATSFSLESLTDELGITHGEKHRAMGDAEATAALLAMAWERLNGLPAALLDELKSVLERSGSAFRDFFGEMTGSTGVGRLALGVSADQSIHTRSAPSRSLSVDEVFPEDGLMAQSWERYEPRPQQQQMAEAVAHAFANDYHLICEAPTGVGKSLAYLVPAAEMAIKNKRRVVISTHTINLQHQLFEKDLRQLRAIYEAGARNSELPVAVLKGRGNYLCLQRLTEFKKRARFSDTDVNLLLKILLFPFLHPKGDLADLTLAREEWMVWNFELSADSKATHGGKCCKLADCYFQKALQAAEDAAIVIVNHALLIADLAIGGGLLPDYDYLVIDEAHQFEEVATRGYGTCLMQENLTVPLKAIQSHLARLKKDYGDTLFSQQSFFDDIQPLTSRAADLLQKTDNVFSVIAVFVSRNVPETKYAESLLIDRALIGSPEWFNLGESVTALSSDIQSFLAEADRFGQKLQGASSQEFPEQEAFLAELASELTVVRDQLDQLKTFFLEDREEAIRYFTSTDSGTVSLTELPLMVGEHLKSDLYDQKKSIILTSATLSTRIEREAYDEMNQAPFEYLRKILSLGDRFEELILDSPFDFQRQAMVVIPKDMESVRSYKSFDQVTDLIYRLAQATQGRFLGLFTSYGVIERLFLALLPLLRQKEIAVLAQKFSGGRNKILKYFLNDPGHSILLGTSSFWEGVDIPGDDLLCVMIHKLPFDVPSDPLHKARSGMFGNGFMQYTLPRAILKFKQGFGRLIRSRKDYGVMVLLDDAISKKEYGQFFLNSLPDVPVERVPLAAVDGVVAEWLRMAKD